MALDVVHACTVVVCCNYFSKWPTYHTFLPGLMVVAFLVEQAAGQLKRLVSLLETIVAPGEGSGQDSLKRKKAVVKGAPKQNGARKRAGPPGTGTEKARKRVATE